MKLKQLIDQFSSYSKDDFGVTRLVYTNEWFEALNALKTLFEQEKFDTKIDNVGNIFGTIRGESEDVIMIGSHFDSVINGGKLDGIYGVLCGYLAIKNLYSKYGKPKKTLCVAGFCEEESVRFETSFLGSGNLLNLLDLKKISQLKDEKNITLKNAALKYKINVLEHKSYDYKRITNFFEIHIEQGKTLDTLKKQIGIIEKIVALNRYIITFYGEANHAGTTLMSYRKDPMLPYSKFVTALFEKAVSYKDPFVCTIGYVNIKPNVPNVIPSSIEFSIDIRHGEKDILNLFEKEIYKLLKNHNYSIKKTIDEKSIIMNEEIIQKTETILKNKKIKYLKMNSGAGHDAQIIGTLIPSNVLFVPSINGISHSPFEDTKIEDLQLGLEIIEDLIKEIAY